MRAAFSRIGCRISCDANVVSAALIYAALIGRRVFIFVAIVLAGARLVTHILRRDEAQVEPLDVEPPSTSEPARRAHGTAQTLTIPTTDRGVVREATAAIPMPNGQTAMGHGLQTALQMLPQRGTRTIVLLTDDVNNRGEDPALVVRRLRAARVTLHAIGLGGTGLAERALQAYAETAGSYARIRNSAQFHPAFASLLVLAAVWLGMGGAVFLPGRTRAA